MIALVVFSLVVFGAAYVVGSAKISLGFRTRLHPELGPGTGKSLRRWLLALLECPACCSWWMGLGAFLLHLTPPHLTTWWIAAFYCCATSLLLARLAGLDEE